MGGTPERKLPDAKGAEDLPGTFAPFVRPWTAASIHREGGTWAFGLPTLRAPTRQPAAGGPVFGLGAQAGPLAVREEDVPC